MDQREATFNMPASVLDDAAKAIQALHGQETIKDGSGAHFSWVNNNFHKRKDFVGLMDEWRWEVELDDDGNVCNISFNGQKLGDDMILFKAIAPFVAAGSYIEMQGEDDCLWRWVFDGKTCTEKYANISWD
jgi:hypothetical protein